VHVTLLSLLFTLVGLLAAESKFQQDTINDSKLASWRRSRPKQRERSNFREAQLALTSDDFTNFQEFTSNFLRLRLYKLEHKDYMKTNDDRDSRGEDGGLGLLLLDSKPWPEQHYALRKKKKK
jgi:hypothetical protein